MTSPVLDLPLLSLLVALALKNIRRRSPRRTFREGEIVSQFIAPDVRREVLVVSAARIEEGIITGRVKTTNLLYVAAGLVQEPEFEPARELILDDIWNWTGQPWGGLPDGRSIVEHIPGGRESGPQDE